MSSNAKPPSARELGLMVGQPAACRAVGHTLQLAGASLEPLGISARRAAHTVSATDARRRYELPPPRSRRGARGHGPTGAGRTADRLRARAPRLLLRGRTTVAPTDRENDAS